MSQFIEKTTPIYTNRPDAHWAAVRDTVSAVLFEAQASRRKDGKTTQPTGDLRVRVHFNAGQCRDEVIVTWDEVA